MKCPRCKASGGIVKSVSYTRGIQGYCSTCGHSWEEVTEEQMKDLRKWLRGEIK
jgi:transposase-like protein